MKNLILWFAKLPSGLAMNLGLKAARDDCHHGTRSLNGGMVNKRSVELGGWGR